MRLITFCALTLGLIACAHPGVTPSTTSAVKPISKKEIARRDAAAAALLSHVPANAIGLIAIHGGAFDWIATWLKDNPAMQAELSAFLEHRLGVDISTVTGMVAYVTRVEGPASDIAVLLTMPMKQPPQLVGTAIDPIDGVRVISMEIEKVQVAVAAVPAGLLIGTVNGLKTAIAREHNQSAALSPGSALSPSLSRVIPDALMVVGVNVQAIPGVGAVAAAYGVNDLLFSGSPSAIELSVGGDPTKLEEARKTLKGFSDKAIAFLEDTRKKALERSVVEGALGIVTYHNTRRWLNEGEPRLLDNRLVSHFEFNLTKYGTPAMMAPAFIGVLAAVAIPNFTKYVNRSKASEARAQLAGLRSTVQSQRIEQMGKTLKVPPSTNWTPVQSACAPGASEPKPVSDAFDAPGWKALGFQPLGPFRYQYRYTTTGKGKQQRVLLEARGDLDCDQTYSRYWIEGTIDPSGNLVFGSMQQENELE